MHTVMRHPVTETRGGLVSRPWARWVDEVTRAALGGAAVTASVTGTATVDWTRGTLQQITLTGDVTLTFAGLGDGQRVTLLVVQDGTGGWTVTWPSDVRWPGNVPPAWTPAADAVDLVTFLRVEGLGTAGVTLGWAELGFVP